LAQSKLPYFAQHLANKKVTRAIICAAKQHKKRKKKMDIANSFKQLKAYARIMWGNLIILSTPFYAGWRIKNFRDKIREGFISFKAAYLFSAYTFFYASLIFAACLFIYFQWLDSSAFMNLFDQTIQTAIPIYKQLGMDISELQEGMKLIREMSAIDITFTILIQNILIGAFLSGPLAVFYKKEPTN